MTTAPPKTSKARPEIDALVDMSNPAEKRAHINAVAPMEGVYEVKVFPKRDTRTLRQLRWWMACVVTPFFHYLKAQDSEVKVYDTQHAHDIIRAKFLTVDAGVDPETGEVITRVRHTKELTPAEFSDFAERARHWLQDFFGIVTEDPDPTWWVKQ